MDPLKFTLPTNFNVRVLHHFPAIMKKQSNEYLIEIAIPYYAELYPNEGEWKEEFPYIHKFKYENSNHEWIIKFTPSCIARLKAQCELPAPTFTTTSWDFNREEEIIPPWSDRDFTAVAPEEVRFTNQEEDTVTFDTPINMNEGDTLHFQVNATRMNEIQRRPARMTDNEYQTRFQIPTQDQWIADNNEEYTRAQERIQERYEGYHEATQDDRTAYDEYLGRLAERPNTQIVPTFRMWMAEGDQTHAPIIGNERIAEHQAIVEARYEGYDEAEEWQRNGYDAYINEIERIGEGVGGPPRTFRVWVQYDGYNQGTAREQAAYDEYVRRMAVIDRIHLNVETYAEIQERILDETREMHNNRNEHPNPYEEGDA